MKYTCILLLFYVKVDCQPWWDHEETENTILALAIDVIKDTNRRIGLLSIIRHDCGKSAAFESGYLLYTLQEKYRQMVDKYNTTILMFNVFYLGEYIIPLVEIEHLYWEIEHISNMLHEIERKYWISGGVEADYVLPSTTETTLATKPTFIIRTKLTTKKTKFKLHKYIMGKITTTQKVIHKWWPFDYGGSVSCFNLPGPQNAIFNEVSWPIKLKLLKELQTKSTGNRRVGIQAYRMQRVSGDEITNEGALVTTELTMNVQKDDSSMKMKLFRLMYETIRDSDVKVRRAEVIKKYYANSTAFNLGYVMGEITDRFNVMSDIALTLQRLYTEWRPMEHINAYEQIANKAVEVSHLADAARNIMKRDSDYLQRYKLKV